MMKRMASDVIASLQAFVDEHGDLPFKVVDNANGVSHFDVTVFADGKGNADDGVSPAIGVSF